MQTENDTTKPETEPKQETGEGCSGATCSAWVIPPCPHCGHDGWSRPYGMNLEIYECNKCAGTWQRPTL